MLAPDDLGASAADLLAALVAHDTRNPGGDEHALVDWLARALEARRAREVVRGRAGAHGWVWARFGGSSPRRVVDVHLDTVPTGPGWSADPLVLRAEGDRLVGLGASDTKGSIAAILAALAGVEPRDTTVLFSGDEERTGTAVADFLRSPAARGLTHAIVCEPTGLVPGVRHRGVLSIEATVRSPGGHSVQADRLPSPLGLLARAAVALDDWGRSWRDRGPEGFEGLCLNLAALDGGVAFNVIPTTATLRLSLRPGPGVDQAALVADVRRLVAAACAPEPVAIAVPLDHPSFATRDPAFFRDWIGGRMDGARGLGFWTEAAILAAAGLDAVVLGPGAIERAHGPDEWIGRGELDEAVALFTRILEA